ncbi:ATP-binding cassette domain-containing protein [Leisingera sp. HS039]|uniref:ABC transporter transmembrane domain-containing protein n=1 Tax=unclassified Leisingera TaxID=2614906 RepID=UPI00142FC8E2|nr:MULTISPECIES: ABC transporter transmembrane domain-containing protein [unclassified Leisingera]MBQ4827358.1 ATP-binding cassette domain-containing protein [Leisingera sp. HS039]
MNSINTGFEQLDGARMHGPHSSVLKWAASRQQQAEPARAAELLTALMRFGGWDAKEAQARAALPHGRSNFDGWDLCDALIALRVPYLRQDGRAAQGPAESGISLYIRRDGSFRLASPASGRAMAGPDETRLSLLPASDASRRPAAQSTAALLKGLQDHVWSLLFASSAINLAGLLTPIFVVLVYNRAIPAGAPGVITVLAAGLFLALATELAIRRIRSRALVSLAAQLEHRLSLALLEKLMVFPSALQQQSASQQQRARLKQFETVRDALVGPLMQVALDAPFVVIFGALLFYIAPPVGFAALAAALAQVAFLAAFAPHLRRQEVIANDAARDWRKLCETVVSQRWHLRRLHGAKPWRQRFHASLANALNASMRQQFLIELSAHASQFLILLAGVAGGLLATRMAIQGELTIGGFVAILVMIWRFLSPVQSLARATGQALAVRQSLRDIDKILAQPEELRREVAPRTAPPVAAPVVVEQAALRFGGSGDLALAGASLSLHSGTITVLSGANMSGKTLLAEILPGLHQLAAGRVLFNGTDQRQIPVDDLRGAIAFAPQEPAFVYGTIWQNFELALPGASQREVLDVLEEAGVRSEIEALPDGMNTRLTVEASGRLPQELLQGMSLARALLQAGPIRIFDQPCEGLDPKHAQRIRAAIARRRASSTTLLISNRPGDLALGDSFTVLHRGRTVLNGKGRKGRDKASAFLNGTLTGG